MKQIPRIVYSSQGVLYPFTLTLHILIPFRFKEQWPSNENTDLYLLRFENQNQRLRHYRDLNLAFQTIRYEQQFIYNVSKSMGNSLVSFHIS